MFILIFKFMIVIKRKFIQIYIFVVVVVVVVAQGKQIVCCGIVAEADIFCFFFICLKKNTETSNSRKYYYNLHLL